MNQLHNTTPYGLMTEKEKLHFCGAAKLSGLYQLYYKNKQWDGCANTNSFVDSNVYRLVIKADAWYYVKLANVDNGSFHLGSKLRNDIHLIDFVDEIHAANPVDIKNIKPKELSLEDRVKAEYGEYEVVMTKEVQHKDVYARKPYLSFEGFSHIAGIQPEHTCAQSMKGFYRYVYTCPKGKIFNDMRPLYPYHESNNLQPIAVLFEDCE